MNHMLLMDDLKLIAKSKNQIDFRLQTVRICSEDIVMQFRIKSMEYFSWEEEKRLEQMGKT